MVLRSKTKSLILFVAWLLFSGQAYALSYSLDTQASSILFAEENKSGETTHFDLNLSFEVKSSEDQPLFTKARLKFFTASYPDYEFSLPEAYISYAVDEHEWGIGRAQIKNISYLDEDWGLGVQTAFVRNNPFFPERQGRTGLYYNLNNQQVFIDVYASPVSIPDQSATYEVSKDGVIRSENPWAILPPRVLVLDTGAELNLNYSLSGDSLPEIILDHQFGGTFGLQTRNIQIYGMYANRPSKQIGFALDAKLQTDQPGLVAVEARPEFSREHFFGIQAHSIWVPGLRMKNGFYGLVKDARKSVTEPYQTSSYDYFMVTTSLHNRFKYFDFGVHHLFQQRKKNTQADVVYIDTDRFFYGNAVKLSFEDIKFKNTMSSFKTVYLYKEQVLNLILQSEISLSKKWKIYSFLNLIHDFEEKRDSQETPDEINSHVQRYSSLDTFSLGVKYVF